MKTFSVKLITVLEVVVEFLFIIIVSFFGVYSQANVLDKGQVIQLSDRREWSKLLHFQNGKSQIKSSEFFINPEGRDNYDLELQSNIELFKNDLNYACRFPARAQYLSRILLLENKKCQAVEDWKQDINAESVSLVYVTQYVSNPASIFGHSYLLFQNKSRPINIDVVFNNAAQVPEQVSTYDYIVKGMFGGFPTIYTKEPFYIKIQEYNNIENRDQWVYELNLSKDQVDQLLNHLWELANLKNEDYFFLNVNCAFNIYNALAAVTNELELMSDSDLYVLPVQTLKKIKRLTTNIVYHPSIRTKIVQKSDQLQTSETREIDEAEIVLDYFEFKKTKNNGELSLEDAAAYKQKLIERSKLGRRKTPFLYESPKVPTDAHETWQMSFGILNQNENLIHSFAVSPFHHSLLQNQAGFLPHSEIIIFDFKISKKDTDNVYFEQATLLKMSNFAEITSFDSQYSWQFETKVNRSENGDYFFNGFADVGKSKKFFENYLFFGLFGFNFRESQTFHPEMRIGLLSGLKLVNLKLQVHWLQNSEDQELRKSLYELAGNYQINKDLDVEINGIFSDEKLAYNINFNHSF